jgi:HD-GYP domain-containing protein (c-di-GMP phosphodiesterase class II)
VSKLTDVLAALGTSGNPSQRAATVLEWALSKLNAEGVALFATPADQSPPGHGGTLETRAALGVLTPTAPLLAAELSRSGIPTCLGVLPLSEDIRDSFLCCPLNTEQGIPWSCLVLQGPSIEESAAAEGSSIEEIRAALVDVLKMERETALGPAFPASNSSPGAALTGKRAVPGGKGLDDLLPGLTVLTEGLRLPLYASDLHGAFTYASPGFLSLTGYASLGALQANRDFFAEPGQRAEELAAVLQHGKVESFHLVVRSGAGSRLEIRDSAVSLGDSILGVFFDVTGLLAANAELKDALQIQELLNDSILAGANQLQRTQGASIRALARLAEYRDPETGFHLQRMCEYTRLIAVEVHRRAPYTFRITMEYANDISMSSMLHDVGKVVIPDHILLKPGKLDAQEWEVMKKHTLFGWEVLHKADRELGEQSFLTLAASIALSHHERFDGKGYPHGAAGEQIPLSARISAIADVYDALTSVRPYKEAWSHERAMEEILGQAGGQFDPVLAQIFSDLAGEFIEVRRRFPG